jgi:tetratricopeptide (TPR) repeat protein
VAGSGGRLKQAIQAGTERDYPRAVSILEEIISETKAPPEAFLFLGRALHALKDYSLAIAAFRDYIRLVPASADGYFFSGRSYLSLDLPHKAIPLFEKALAIKSGSPEIMALLGYACLKARRSGAAVEMLRKAVEAAAGENFPQKQSRRIYRAYLNALLIRGIKHIRNDNPSLGIEMLNFILENGAGLLGDFPLLRIELGRAHRDLGELPEALEQYSRAVEMSPGDPQLRWYRASLLMAMGWNSDALEELEAIKALGHELPRLPWNSDLVDRFMIQSFMEAGQWRRVGECCRAWIKTRGPDPNIHIIFAEAQRNLGDFVAAKNHLDRALELSPGQVQIWYSQILVAWEGGDWQGLRRALRKAGELKGDPAILIKYTILCEAKNNDDDRSMLALLQDGIYSFGPDPDLMYALGERYLKVGLTEEALSWFEKIPGLAPLHERSYLGIIAACEALFIEGRKKVHARLERAYKRYLEKWPDNRTILREQALFLVRVCDFSRAAEKLETLLAWEPVNPTLRRVLAYAYRKSGRYREAAVLIKGLLREKPDDIALLLEFSGCLERAGSVYYAQMTLKKAFSVFKKSSDVALALALLHYRDGQIEKAFDFFREAAVRNTKDHRPYTWMAAIARKHGQRHEASHYEYEAKKRKKGSNGPKRS